MGPMTFRIFLAIVFSVSSSCILFKETNEDKIIVISEELKNEFKSNEKTAIKKYKNKRLQVIGEISEIATPEHSRHRKDESSGISLYEEHCYFIFYFDYNVKRQHSQKKGDKVIIQGYFKDFSRRMITEYDYEKKADGEKYWEEFDTSFFVFKKSEIIGGTQE